MTAKELKRLSRSDLLEMMLALSKENEMLRQQLEDTKKQLEDQRIIVEEEGSLAGAVLRLNGFFEAAQAACEQYKENIQMRCRDLEQQTQARCSELERETQTRCNALIAEAKKQTESYAWLTEIIDESES